MQGYRYWTYGWTNHSEPHLAEGWVLHTRMVSNIDQAREVLDALSLFVKVLDKCATCPLKTLPSETHGVSRDECLVLGLISAIQHGDEQLTEMCLSQLTCASHCFELAAVAERYAITLRSLDKKLQPIPRKVIDDILVRSNSITIH